MGLQKFLDQLIEEEKIIIDESSVVVEFACGCNITAARIVSKYKPKIYYANDFDPGYFNSKSSDYPKSWKRIDRMRVNPVICDVLDVDYFVKNYDIGLFYNSLRVIDSGSFPGSLLPLRTRTYWSWLKKVKEELKENNFETLTRYLSIGKEEKSLSKWLEYIKNNREHIIELLEREITRKKDCNSHVNRFFNTVYLLIEKIYNSLNKNGSVLIFDEDSYFVEEVEKTFRSIQECGYIKFREIKLLSSLYSNDGLLYALK